MPSIAAEIESSATVTDNGAYAHYVQVRKDRIAAEAGLYEAIANWQKAGKPESWKAHLHWLNGKVTDMINEEARLAGTFEW